MEKIRIETTEGILRAVKYCSQNGINQDLAMVYLTILLKNHTSEEKLEPLPIWIFGLSNISVYLNYFKRYNMIFKSGNSYSISEFIKSESTVYSISNPPTVDNLVDLSVNLIELGTYFTAS